MFDKREFEIQLVRKGIQKKELAKLLGISYTSLYRKIESGRFTREEINKLIKILGIEDPMPIFFAPELT